MRGTENRELPLRDISSSGCACCVPADTESDEKSIPAVAQESAPAEATVRAAYQVAGMTCGHCSSSVAGALANLNGVSDVQVALIPGGVSTVTIAATRPVADADVRDAVAEVGYEVVPS